MNICGKCFSYRLKWDKTSIEALKISYGIVENTSRNRWMLPNFRVYKLWMIWGHSMHGPHYKNTSVSKRSPPKSLCNKSLHVCVSFNWILRMNRRIWQFAVSCSVLHRHIQFRFETNTLKRYTNRTWFFPSAYCGCVCVSNSKRNTYAMRRHNAHNY